CRGTPRVAIRLLRRMRDYAQVRGDNVVNREICEMGLTALDIDQIGLDGNDRLIMRVMAEMYGGGPVGLDTLAASTGEDAVTIEDIYEPYLMQIGFIAKTPRGRILTKNGFSHLGLPYIDRGTREIHGGAQISLHDILESESQEQEENC
ncbi:MAG TPA: Holliday junction DNA helicase RuvB C-terminal domain-containing protein, partial [Clostridia bacterium]|nr:Holliday junction DNA helicase RuvB C-terminal domain-containing protein [Clostridia bacterium]